jgi:hypothetical protein
LKSVKRCYSHLGSDGPPVTPFLTVCSPLAEAAGVGGVTLSVPHLVGGNGILGTPRRHYGCAGRARHLTRDA